VLAEVPGDELHARLREVVLGQVQRDGCSSGEFACGPLVARAAEYVGQMIVAYSGHPSECAEAEHVADPW
jgi:hypothetical protein